MKCMALWVCIVFSCGCPVAYNPMCCQGVCMHIVCMWIVCMSLLFLCICWLPQLSSVMRGIPDKNYCFALLSLPLPAQALCFSLCLCLSAAADHCLCGSHRPTVLFDSGIFLKTFFRLRVCIWVQFSHKIQPQVHTVALERPLGWRCGAQSLSGHSVGNENKSAR